MIQNQKQFALPPSTASNNFRFRLGLSSCFFPLTDAGKGNCGPGVGAGLLLQELNKSQSENLFLR